MAQSKSYALISAVFASGMIFIDRTIVNIAVPFVQASFDLESRRGQQIIISYEVAVASTILLGGLLSHRFGHRFALFTGLLLIAGGATAAGFSSNFVVFISGRVCQGIGAAIVLPTSLAMINHAFEKHERARAAAIWTSASALSFAVGTVAGSFLIDILSWRLVFLANIPLCLAITFFTKGIGIVRPESDRTHWPTAVALGIGLGCITHALLQIQQTSTLSLSPVALLVIAFTSMVVSLVLEKRGSQEYAIWRLFAIGEYGRVSSLTFFLYATFGVFLFYFPSYVIGRYNYSATKTAVMMLPMFLMIAAAAHFAPALLRTLPPNRVLFWGCLATSLGYLIMSFFRDGLACSFGALLVGAGMGVSASVITTMVVQVEPSLVALGSAVNTSCASAGAAIAVALFGFAPSITSRLADLVDWGVNGFSLQMTLAAMISSIAAIVSIKLKE